MMTQKASKLLPFFYIHNVRAYYLLHFLRQSKPYLGIWIFYWLKFMDYQTLGKYQAICFGIGLLSTIPVGALTDLIGKKKGMIISCLACGVGSLLMGFAIHSIYILIGFLLVNIGWSFYGASGEGLVFEDMKHNNVHKNYDKVSSFSTILAIYSSAFFVAIGGFLYTFNPRIPYLLWGTLSLIALIPAFYFNETYENRDKINLINYFKQNYQGLKELLKPQMRAFFIILLSLRGSLYLYNMGTLRPAISIFFGFLEDKQSLLFSFTSLVCGLFVLALPKFRTKISDKKALYSLTIILGLCFLVSSFNIGYWGIIPLVIIGICGALCFPWISVVINHNVRSRYRATTISTVNLLMKLPYVLTATFLAKVIENQKLPQFNLGLGIIIILSVITSAYIYYITEKKYKYNLKYQFNKLLISWKK